MAREPIPELRQGDWIGFEIWRVGTVHLAARYYRGGAGRA